MEAIFHEKQEGSLCAQHCLNALLQAPYFTAVELATLARQIDEEERSQMAEGGVQSEDYRKFIQSAYICNFRDHWLTIRKIGNQWFNLNSLLVGPELISDTYLALFLAQLQDGGYAIFIVDGKLPECTADALLRVTPAVQREKPCLISELKAPYGVSQEEDEDKALNDALTQTLAESIQMEDDCLQAALSMSLSEFQSASSTRNRSSGNAANYQYEQQTRTTSHERRLVLCLFISCC
ncbi:Ataxin-3 like protein [Argiope bruennichi]|uniref:ubiquitinyl hydrolase 1 n=1 Tax=Argiope bruennichi TaxID=94029 RepID=A0A8T0G4W6_ARGBR|nr:Ataxin-3 like protein [Argiope bruennichi]